MSRVRLTFPYRQRPKRDTTTRQTAMLLLFRQRSGLANQSATTRIASRSTRQLTLTLKTFPLIMRRPFRSVQEAYKWFWVLKKRRGPAGVKPSHRGLPDPQGSTAVIRLPDPGYAGWFQTKSTHPPKGHSVGLASHRGAVDLHDDFYPGSLRKNGSLDE